MIPPLSWDAFDFVLQFNFYYCTHFWDKEPSSKFFIHLEMDPNEKIIFKIREVIPSQPIEVNIESTGIAQE